MRGLVHRGARVVDVPEPPDAARGLEPVERDARLLQRPRRRQSRGARADHGISLLVHLSPTRRRGRPVCPDNLSMLAAAG